MDIGQEERPYVLEPVVEPVPGAVPAPVEPDRVEAPEPVHVELGLDKMSAAGKHLALVSASYASSDQAQGTLGIMAPMRMHYERVITAVAFMAQYLSDSSEEDRLS